MATSSGREKLLSLNISHISVVPGFVDFPPYVGMRLAIKEMSKQLLVAAIGVGLRIIIKRTIIHLTVGGHTELMPALLPGAVLHLLVALSEGGEDLGCLFACCEIAACFGLSYAIITPKVVRYFYIFDPNF